MRVAEPKGGYHVLLMSGSLQAAPFLTDWKSLKDDIRKNVGYPGYTRVSSIVQRGTRRGWCNFTQENDARAAYSMLLYRNSRKSFL
jgi:hypothetical protein